MSLREREQQIAQAQERFRLVVEASPSGIVLMNGEGRVVLVNAETERLFGYTREELTGKPVEMLVPERFRGDHPGLPGRIPRRAARTRHGLRTGALRPPQGRDGVHRRNRIEPGSARGRAARPGRHRGRHRSQAGRGRDAATAGRADPRRSHVHHGPAGDGPGARAEPAARSDPAQCGGRRAPAAEQPAGPGGGARHPRRHLQGRPPRGRGHRSHAGSPQAARPGTRQAPSRGAGRTRSWSWCSRTRRAARYG